MGKHAAQYTPMSTRTHIIHSVEQKQRLEALSRKTGATVSELIRRFIDKGLAQAEKAK